MSLRIRTAVPAEMPALIDLWVEAWTAFLPEIDFEGRRPWFAARLETLLHEGAVAFAAVGADQALLGFVTVDARRQDMDQLATAPFAQRRGVGRALVGAAKHHAPGGLSLKVNQRNSRAIGLYQSEGFVVTGDGVSALSGLPLFHMRWPSHADRR